MTIEKYLISGLEDQIPEESITITITSTSTSTSAETNSERLSMGRVRPQRVALVTSASLRRHNGDSLRVLAQARGLWECGFREFTVFTSEPDPALPWPQERITAYGPLRFIFDQPRDFSIIHAHQNAGLFLKGRVWADLHGFAPMESGLDWRAHPWSARAAGLYGVSAWAIRRLARRCERLICAAESIAENVRRALPGARCVKCSGGIDVVRNCIDVREYAAAPCEELVVGVIGSFGGRWGTSLYRMAREVAARAPEVRFRMVGRMSAEQRVELEGAGNARDGGLRNVELLGEVDEEGYRRFFREASVALIAYEDWCRGGGSRQKLLQAAVSGLAIVATPAGIEGFEAPPEVLVGRTPAELAELIRNGLKSAEERRRRGATARRVVEEKHDTLSEGRRLAEMYDRALRKA